jgi:uncharacterized protein (TIGR00290 family)
MWSGGKDSALALHRARAQGLPVTRLLNFYDAPTNRVRFHATRIELLRAQAEAAGVSLTAVGTTWPEMEARLGEELRRLRDEGFSGVVLGDIHLADVRAWYEERVTAAGLEHVEPLWAEPPSALLREFVESGGRAVVTCVELARLDQTWLGRLVDQRFLVDIERAGVDACGENGEFHTFAFAGPVFRGPVGWGPGDRHSEGGFLQLDLLLAPGRPELPEDQVDE